MLQGKDTYPSTSVWVAQTVVDGFKKEHTKLRGLGRGHELWRSWVGIIVIKYDTKS